MERIEAKFSKTNYRKTENFNTNEIKKLKAVMKAFVYNFSNGFKGNLLRFDHQCKNTEKLHKLAKMHNFASI